MAAHSGPLPKIGLVSRLPAGGAPVRAVWPGQGQCHRRPACPAGSVTRIAAAGSGHEQAQAEFRGVEVGDFLVVLGPLTGGEVIAEGTTARCLASGPTLVHTDTRGSSFRS